MKCLASKPETLHELSFDTRVHDALCLIPASSSADSTVTIKTTLQRDECKTFAIDRTCRAWQVEQDVGAGLGQ